MPAFTEDASPEPQLVIDQSVDTYESNTVPKKRGRTQKKNVAELSYDPVTREFSTIVSPDSELERERTLYGDAKQQRKSLKDDDDYEFPGHTSESKDHSTDFVPRLKVSVSTPVVKQEKQSTRQQTGAPGRLQTSTPSRVQIDNASRVQSAVPAQAAVTALPRSIAEVPADIPGMKINYATSTITTENVVSTKRTRYKVFYRYEYLHGFSIGFNTYQVLNHDFIVKFFL